MQTNTKLNTIQNSTELSTLQCTLNQVHLPYSQLQPVFTRRLAAILLYSNNVYSIPTPGIFGTTRHPSSPPFPSYSGHSESIQRQIRGGNCENDKVFPS